MATTNQKVTAGDTLSATVRYSNKDNASRSFDISASVNMQHNRVNSIENGEVRKMQSGELGETEQTIATFSTYSDRSLNLNIRDADPEESGLILNEVTAFISGVRSDVSSTTKND